MMLINDQQKTQLLEFAQVLFEKAGFNELKLDLKPALDKQFILVVETDDPNLFIGKEGKNLNAFQQIIQYYYNFNLRDPENENYAIITLDSGNYRLRREEALVHMAMEIADWVQDNQKSTVLKPLPPFERRIIHMTLQELTNIKTESLGDGYLKSIQVSYK